jgi:Ca2+-binding EF-hand superfamily protein
LTRDEITMICSRRAFSSAALAAAATFVIGQPVLAATRRGRAESFAMLDSDHDGTIDQGEADKAAAAAFDRLDADHDGTVSRRELGGKVGAAEFAAADTDKDGTLTRDEYLALVKQCFGDADSDHDGTLTAAEFHSKAGMRLRSLLS